MNPLFTGWIETLIVVLTAIFAIRHAERTSAAMVDLPNPDTLNNVLENRINRRDLQRQSWRARLSVFVGKRVLS
jgi:uncharacterized membrane protein